MRRATITSAGGVVAAFLASLCCVGPLLFVSLGVGAGLASTFEPLRPLFGGVMLALFAVGFWTVYGRRSATTASARSFGASSMEGATREGTRDCASGGATEGAPGVACAVPWRRRRDEVLLWSAVVVALLLWTFPTWSIWLL